MGDRRYPFACFLYQSPCHLDLLYLFYCIQPDTSLDQAALLSKINQSQVTSRALRLIMVWVLSLTTLLVAILGRSSPALSQNPATATTVWEFSNHTWVENLAVRSNGQILTTLGTTPELYQVDPNHQLNATLVHSFPNAISCLGITETTSDVFYIAVGNYSFDTFRTAPGSWSVWRVDMAPFVPGEHPAHVAKVGGDYPESRFLTRKGDSF